MGEHDIFYGRDFDEWGLDDLYVAFGPNRILAHMEMHTIREKYGTREAIRVFGQEFYNEWKDWEFPRTAKKWVGDY